jgi:heptosyltransferase III
MWVDTAPTSNNGRNSMQTFNALAGPSGAASCASRTLPRTGIFRILVCRTSHSLGNTLFMTPLLQEIDALWPGAEVDLITRYASAPQIFASYPSMRSVMVLPRRLTSQPWRWLKTLWRMHRTSYDLVIDTDLRSRTGRLLLRLAQAPHKLGFAGRGALTVAIDATQAPKHAAHSPAFLLQQALGLARHEYPPLSTRLTTVERREGLTRLLQVVGSVANKSRGVIGIFANATGPKAMSTRWWADFMREAETHLAAYTIVEIIPAFGESMLGGRYCAYYSSDIRNLSKFLSALSMLVCLDCGIMHLARASGTPVGAVFTTTDVDIWGPYGTGAHVARGDAEHPQLAARALMAMLPIASPAAA